MAQCGYNVIGSQHNSSWTKTTNHPASSEGAVREESRGHADEDGERWDRRSDHRRWLGRARGWGCRSRSGIYRRCKDGKGIWRRDTDVLIISKHFQMHKHRSSSETEDGPLVEVWFSFQRGQSHPTHLTTNDEVLPFVIQITSNGLTIKIKIGACRSLCDRNAGPGYRKSSILFEFNL